MEVANAIDKLLSFGGGTVGTSAVQVPGSAATYRRAIQICNCAPTGSDQEIYVGYDATVTSSKHVARCLAGGAPVELQLRSTVGVWIVGSVSSVAYAVAEVG